MSVVTVRNLPEETHRTLKLRAAQHGRSTEAEIREILEEVKWYRKTGHVVKLCYGQSADHSHEQEADSPPRKRS